MKRWRSTLRPWIARWGAAWLIVSGCAVRDHAPYMPPTFMREGIVFGEAPFAESGSGAPPSMPEPKPAPPPRPIDKPGLVALGRPVAEPPAEPIARLGFCLNEDDAAKGTLPDPKPADAATPRGITLDEAIDATLNADPKLQAAWQTINQAKADLLTDSLVPNPTLLVDGILLPLTRSFTPNRQGGPPQLDVQPGFPIDWFLFGKRAAAIASGRLGVEQSAADFADTVRTRVAATVAAYYDVLEAQALLDLARQDLASQKRVEGITKDRLKIGGVGAVELDRIRLAVYDSQREVRKRETTLATAKANLRALMGRRDPDPAFAVAGALKVVAAAAPVTTEEALAIADEERPDLISLRRQVDKAEADIRVERTKGFPSVTPSFTYTRQFQEKAIGFPDASSYGLTLNMSLPVFDRNQGNVAKAQATHAQIYYNLQTQLVSLRAEIEQAVQEFRAAYVNVTSDDPKQLELAESVRDRIEAAYKKGGRTLLDVIDAQRAYRETYRSQITNQSSYWHALHKLNAAIGRQMLR